MKHIGFKHQRENKQNRDQTEILLKVVLNTIILALTPSCTLNYISKFVLPLPEVHACIKNNFGFPFRFGQFAVSNWFIIFFTPSGSPSLMKIRSPIPCVNITITKQS